MGGIADEHVEWAVVNRLKAMLDAPPKTRFNVTQSFALFSAVLLWTKQRAWVGGEAMERHAGNHGRQWASVGRGAISGRRRGYWGPLASAPRVWAA
jgi:hypothetical protein